MRTRSPLLRAAVAAFLVVPVWFFGGMGPAGRSCLPWLIAFAWAMMIVSGCWKQAIRDELLWMGLILLLVLGVQYINSPREMRFYFATKQFRPGPAKIPWLPSAFEVVHDKKVLIWFAWALTCLVAARHGLDAEDRQKVMRAIGYNGLLVLIVGAGFSLAGTKRVMGIFPNGAERWFGPFGYVNAFAAYCLLLCGIVWQLGSRWRLALIPFGIAIIGSGCLAATLLYGLFIAAVVIKWANDLPAYENEHLGVCLTLALLLSIGFLTWENRGYLQRKLVEQRMWQTKSAVEIWWDKPWFGVGAGGYNTLAPFYMPFEETWRLQERGRANVHNDWAQYLLEFGSVGAVCVAVVAFMAVRGGRRRDWWALLGLGLVGIHAGVDLPFRCPAILIMSAFILAHPLRKPGPVLQEAVA